MKFLKNVRIIAFCLIVAATLFAFVADRSERVAPTASATVATFRADLVTAFTNNFTAPQRQEIANAFVSAYPVKWQADLKSGKYTDTTANRGQFAIDRIIEYVSEVRTSEMKKANISALPTPTPLP